MARAIQNPKPPAAMSVAGSDSGAGAGIQADVLTFAAHGVYGTTAITAITAQNPDKVGAISPCDAGAFAKQLELCASFYAPAAAKTGMLFDAKTAELCADFFDLHPNILLVVDPVMFSTSGAKLLKDDASNILKTRLIPRSTIFTPNLDEASFLLGGIAITPDNQMESAARLAKEFGACALLKGGHLSSDLISDILAFPDGRIVEFPSKRVRGVDTHGSGCTLSAAITANLALGLSVENSCLTAQKYIVECMRHPIEVGGRRFINHFPPKSGS